MGKGGESSKSSSSLRSSASASAKSPSLSSEVLIDGVWYDTSSFKHPGGRVLSYYAGRDATQVGPTVHLFGFWFDFCGGLFLCCFWFLCFLIYA